MRQWNSETGHIVSYLEYDPFGVLQSVIGVSNSPYGYTGEHYDVMPGLVYLRARWYAPVTGRFLQVDPWPGDYERPQSLNRFVYVENNAVNWADPSGLFRTFVVRGANADNPAGLAVRSVPSVHGRLLRRIPDGTRVMTWEDFSVPGWDRDGLRWYSLVRIGNEVVAGSYWPRMWAASKYLVDESAPPALNPTPIPNPRSSNEALSGFRLGPLFQAEDGTLLPYTVWTHYGSTEGFQSWLPDLGRNGHNGVDLVPVPTVRDSPCEDNVGGRRILSPVDGTLTIHNPDVCKAWDNLGNCIEAGRDPETNPPGITLRITQIPNYADLEIQLTHVYPHQSAGPVQRGSILGYYAQIGYSNSPHLHLTMKWRGNVFNPEPYLP